MDFVDNCYLIKHAQGWFLWDTGIADAVAAMPNGQAPADPRATTGGGRRRLRAARTTRRQALRHQGDGGLAYPSGPYRQCRDVPAGHALVQKAEYDWPGANNEPRFKPEHPVDQARRRPRRVRRRQRDHLSTPGHTPGHQSLLVKLPKTGAVLLSGDAVHFKDNWDNRRVPANNINKDQTLASMQKHRRHRWPRKRRSSGSTMTRRSATARRCRRSFTMSCCPSFRGEEATTGGVKHEAG